MATKKVPRTKVDASPGVAGALKDAMGALAAAVAPKSITQHKAHIEDQVEPDRYRRNQQTDSSN